MTVTRQCVVCGSEFQCDKKSSKKCCSTKCSSKLRQQTNLSKYGITNVQQLQRHTQAKVCNNCGSEFMPTNNNSRYCDKCRNSFKTPIEKTCTICGKLFMDKSKLHNRTMCASCKYKKTIQAKYNVDNISKLDKTILKIKQTKLDKYGDCNYTNQNKAKRTNLVRYGVPYTFQSDVVKQKIYNTNQEKYGTPYPSCNDEIKLKKKIMAQEKYGVDCVLQANSVKDKIKKTNLTRYGTTNVSQCDMIKDKVKQTNLAKYGVPYTFQSDEIKQKIYNTNLTKYGVPYSIQNKNVQMKSIKTCMSKYGVPFPCMRPECKYKAKVISKTNLKFQEALNNNQIVNKLEKPIEGKSFDIFIPPDICIEIDPTWTHNTYCNYIGRVHSNPKALMNNQLNKTLLARKYNMRCIHIFDWDDWNKILYMLKEKQTLYARKLDLKEVSKDETDKFLNKYHLQNTCKGQTIRLGLYKDNELIEIMTFGKPRYNKNYEWELLRLCSHKDYKVVGGAERLFNQFIKTYTPTNVISYCDYSKFSGDVYDRLGFIRIGKINPSKQWSKGKQHITDNLLRQRGYDQLFGTNYGKGTSNEELMLDNGWLPVYDCGQLTYIYK